MTDSSIGYIHSIETAGTVDGPGLRYVLFLEMCPFKCLYCHNPDTWFKHEENKKNVKDIILDILKYKDFFDFTNGGVTVSGGEPLLQSKFLLELFKNLKNYNIHTCIDTCGYVDIDKTIEELVEYTDLFMVDIKHLDYEKHIELTGKSNEKVINFLNYLNKKNKNIRIRQVLVPTYTVDDEYIKKLILFLEKYRNNIEKIELLPYHDMGKIKWERLNLTYKLDVLPLDNSTLEKIKTTVINCGYEVL